MEPPVVEPPVVEPPVVEPPVVEPPVVEPPVVEPPVVEPPVVEPPVVESPVVESPVVPPGTTVDKILSLFAFLKVVVSIFTCVPSEQSAFTLNFKVNSVPSPVHSF